jgi:oxygen-independent coproporphyrinogen III oxidase
MSQTLPLLAPPADTVEDPYVAYAYSYPHKSAYGPLDPPVPLGSTWQAERREALFLYFHIPFCEMRCGFCNLFARAGGDAELTNRYLDAVERQARVLGDLAAPCRVARLAIGGGTPTYLSPTQLQRLFDIARYCFGADPRGIPTSVETSPKTATADRVACLRDNGVERISIGVQSFIDDEAHAIGRPQLAAEVHAALERLRDFPVLNVDLIYGLPRQTARSWLASIAVALRYGPEELYLYPLYVRPGTGLGRRGGLCRSPVETTRLLYREGRDALRAAGYEQVSMRYFRRPRAAAPKTPVYCCQSDGMLGLGCGARSYTSALHYSSPFAVEPAPIHALLERWIGQSDDAFAHASWGCRLTRNDQRRRFVIQSLLTYPGLSAADYASRFAEAVEDGFPELLRLGERGFVEYSDSVYRLTASGMECSDAIGPLLYAPAHRARLEAFARP